MGTLRLPGVGKELGWKAGPQDRGPWWAGEGTAARTPGKSNGEELGRHGTSHRTFCKQSSGLLGGRNRAAEPLAERWLRQGGHTASCRRQGHTHTQTHTHTDTHTHRHTQTQTHTLTEGTSKAQAPSAAQGRGRALNRVDKLVWF